MKKFNKKTFVVGIAALFIAAGAAVNVGVFSMKDKQISNLSLANVEVHASIFDYLGEWWDAKEYTCKSKICSAVISQTLVTKMDGSTSWMFLYGPGHKMKCEGGEDYAHCWECETECVPDK